MRSIWLIGAVVVLLGACATEKGHSGSHSSGPPGGHPHGRVEASASTVESPLPPGLRHPHDHTDSIPAAFHGVYEGSLKACTRRSDQRLTVSEREVRFHESVGSVSSVAYGGARAIAVEADYEGEGQRWRSLRLLSLSEDGTRLTVKGEGTSVDRVRCPRGAR